MVLIAGPVQARDNNIIYYVIVPQGNRTVAGGLGFHWQFTGQGTPGYS